MVKYVTTDLDMWNSADEAYFAVLKGQVKPLPEETTSIIEDALEQGLLREANAEEVKEYDFQQAVEEAVRTRKIGPGKTYEGTVQNYRKFLEQQETIKEKPVEKKEEKPEVKIEKPKEQEVKKESKAEISK